MYFILGAVRVERRIIKEKSMYQKEVIQAETRLEKMKSDGQDIHDIRKMVSEHIFCFVYLCSAYLLLTCVRCHEGRSA